MEKKFMPMIFWSVSTVICPDLALKACQMGSKRGCVDVTIGLECLLDNV